MNGKVERNDLSDRVAIVTGGAGLLGSDYCHTLSAAGAHVCIADIESEAANTLAARITKSTGVAAIAHRTDVSDASSVGACVQATMDRFGRIDILVNNAAINPKFDRDQAESH
ncbi:MAG: SDR family NAD(P)-dependent oxidoreductase, partial [Anaerolineales bacterium]